MTPTPFSSDQHKDWTALVLGLQIVCKKSFTDSMIFENAFKDVQHSFMSPLLETLSNVTLSNNEAVKKCKDEFGPRRAHQTQRRHLRDMA